MHRGINSDPMRAAHVLISGMLVMLLSSATNAFALEEVPLYGLYETAIDYAALTGASHPYEDPFYGVDLNASFTSPSGRRVEWWGFFDGDGLGAQDGDIWKIRFMPDELGTWRFDWRFEDNGLSGTGSFQAVDNAAMRAKPGPLAHDPLIHQWLITADGSRHVFPNMLQMNLPQDSAKTIDQTIQELKLNGFDVLMIQGTVASRLKPLDENNPFHWMDTKSYIPRLQGWHIQEKELFKAVYEQDVYLYDWAGFYAGNGWIDLHEKPKSLQNEVIKYSLLRTAPYFFYLYNIGFELPEYVSVPSWPVERAQFVKALDPWDHLVTAHELHGWSYGEASEIGFSALQNNGAADPIDRWKNIKTFFKNLIYRPWWTIREIINDIVKFVTHRGYYYESLRGRPFHEIALIVWNSPSKPHPHCDECIWNAEWQAPGTEESHRKDLWEGITGGMSYSFYAEDSDTGLAAFRHANYFLKSGVEWWTMSPHDEVVQAGSAYVLANLGREYLVYSSSGAEFTLKLPGGTYEFRWFDPASGQFEDKKSLINSDTAVVFQKPDAKDWVLHVAAVNDLGVRIDSRERNHRNR
jgi:hypothetical protein